MSGWPLTIPGYTETDKYDVGNTAPYAVTVTANSTVNTKGSWTELVASTSQDCYLLGIEFRSSFVSGTNTGILVDIGIGAAASEVVLIADMLAGWKTSTENWQATSVPVFIPAGTRIAARSQAVISSDTVVVGVMLLGTPNSFNHDMHQGGNVVTYGADTTNTRGIDIPSGAGADTKGAWTQITASTTQPHSAIGLSVAGGVNTSLSSQNILFDVGFGAASSEQIILKDIFVQQSSSERQFISDQFLSATGIGRVIPSGSRLAVRAQYELVSDNTMDICLHGVT